MDECCCCWCSWSVVGLVFSTCVYCVVSSWPACFGGVATIFVVDLEVKRWRWLVQRGIEKGFRLVDFLDGEEARMREWRLSICFWTALFYVLRAAASWRLWVEVGVLLIRCR